MTELGARTLELLEELLAEKGRRIRSLKAKLKKLRATLVKKDDEIRSLEYQLDQLPGGWNIPDEDEDIPHLPLPRMEFRWYPFFDDNEHRDPWARYRVISSLVYRDLNNKIISVPFGNTVSSGHSGDGKPWEERHPLPARDGATAFYVAAHLDVPLYAVPPEDEGVPWRLDRNHELAEDYRWQMTAGAGSRRKA